MVHLDLMASLGLTRNAVYDGAYETPEEQACSSLLNHVADWCDMQLDEITGLWDTVVKIMVSSG